jgi:replicative DNA helicase
MDYLPPEETNSISSQQPHNREAEEAVLGAVLIFPESYFDLSQKLKGDDFYIIRNRWVWEAYSTLIERRQKIDLLTVSAALNEKNHLEEIGGTAYLATLINQTPTSLHAEAYAEIVEENAMRRRMLEAANHLAKQAYDRGKSVNTLLDEAEKAVFGLSERRITYDLQPIQQVLGSY